MVSVGWVFKQISQDLLNDDDNSTKTINNENRKTPEIINKQLIIIRSD